MSKNLETLCIHGGYKAENGQAQVLPITQSTTYRHDTPEHLADLFDLKELGYIYSRLGNPTVEALENKINALEGGVGGLAFSSGQAAITASILTVASAGDHIIASTNLYGGSITLLTSSLKRLGIEVTLVDPNAPLTSFEEAIQDNTKILYGETIGNPGLNVLDFEKFSKFAKDNHLLFIVDNTFATPLLFRPLEHGANIVVHSLTKYIDGHATSLGGVIVDGGNFDYVKSGRFPVLTEADPSYHGLVFTDTFKEAAYIFKARVHVLRDFGGALSPFNAFLIHNSLETLHLRMERHSENALALAKYLENHDQVEWVKYPLLESHESYDLAKKYLKKGASGVLSFGIKGGLEAAKSFQKNIELVSLVTHVGDLRTSVLHPASTSHRQLSDEALEKSGVTQDLIRVSIGLENIDDIIADFEQALKG